jgi:thymidylate kinase
MGELQSIAAPAPRCDFELTLPREHHGKIITFSGIDGAGKTTQIVALSTFLSQQGHRVLHVTFWDDVAVLSKMRAGVSLSLFRKASGTAEQQPLRNDKNVRTWYLMLIRGFFYLLDTLNLRCVVAKLRREGCDFVIFDRYVYDQLVQIRTHRWISRVYIRLLLHLAPTPEFPFILDASPDQAFARKPEYPLEFMRGYRQAFLGLCAFGPHMAIVGPSEIDETQRLIVHRIAQGSRLPT